MGKFERLQQLLVTLIHVLHPVLLLVGKRRERPD